MACSTCPKTTSRVKLVEVEGKKQYVTINTFNQMVEKGMDFKDLGTKEI